MSRFARCRLYAKLQQSGDNDSLAAFHQAKVQQGIRKGRPKLAFDNAYTKVRLLNFSPKLETGSDWQDVDLAHYVSAARGDVRNFPGFVGDIATGMSWVGITNEHYRSRRPGKLLLHLMELDTITTDAVAAVGPYSPAYARKVASVLKTLSLLLEREFRRCSYFVDIQTGELSLVGGIPSHQFRCSRAMVKRLRAQQ